MTATTKTTCVRTIFENSTPVTQPVDAVRALLTWRGHPIDPLPASVTLGDGRMMLVLNAKKDAYYVVTPSACSCPSAQFRPGKPCKHQRAYFPRAKTTPEPVDSIRPDMRGFRPVSLLPGEVAEVA